LDVRVDSGVEGLNELLDGGFPLDSLVLVTGTAGTGKTLLALQYLYKGAKVLGEPGIYVTLEEPPASLKRDVRRFGWDLDELERAGRLRFIDLALREAARPRRLDVNDVFETVEAALREAPAKRLVVDPVTVIGFHSSSPLDVRQSLLRFGGLVRRFGCTTLMTTEILEESSGLGRFGVEEFVSDGVIVLYYSKVGGLRLRGLEVRKMRGSSHREGVFPLKIGPSGIVVNPSGKFMLGKGVGGSGGRVF
jgi:circadian clock protein KaiC